MAMVGEVQAMVPRYGEISFTKRLVEEFRHGYCVLVLVARPLRGVACARESNQGCCQRTRTTLQEITMQWTKPAFSDLRFGFEVTMYIANR
jgi:coenzyme PQQ precursor peptide PqqA